jgi:hypothetical protein
MRTRVLSAFALFILVCSTAAAEIKLPQPSPAATAVQAIGISEVKVTYHRPAVKGRTIWGGLVPYGEVWRLGANEATTLELSHDATIDGKPVPAGRYSLFAIPAKDDWTLVLNRTADQWGAYFYKQDQDLLRFKVTSKTGPHVEWMTFAVTPASDSALDVEMAWEKLRVPFRIEFDVDGIMWKQIDAEVAKAKPEEWEVWHNAARYANEKNQRTADAMVWIDKAMAHESFWNYELKALMLQKQGKTADAVVLMKKAMENAKGKAPQGYIDGLQKVKDGWAK